MILLSNVQTKTYLDLRHEEFHRMRSEKIKAVYFDIHRAKNDLSNMNYMRNINDNLETLREMVLEMGNIFFFALITRWIQT
jgi:hypothetical protein